MNIDQAAALYEQRKQEHAAASKKLDEAHAALLGLCASRNEGAIQTLGEAYKVTVTYGVNRTVDPAASAGTDGNHESVRVDGAAIREFDVHGALNHQRTRSLNADHPRCIGAHVLSARITAMVSVRTPGCNMPCLSSHRARDRSTGPNGITCRATTVVRNPPMSSNLMLRLISANSDCTIRTEPPGLRSSGTALQSGSRTSLPLGPALYVTGGPASPPGS